MSNDFMGKYTTLKIDEDGHMPIYEPKPAKPYVGQDGIYVPHCVDPTSHMLLISRELFVEAYNKWIKNQIRFTCEDDADCWCE